MCGLVGYISKVKTNTAGAAVLDQFQDQISRGKEGFGLVEINKDALTIQRATEQVKAIIDTKLSTAPIALFHHRYPTSTDNTMRQTHPFLISHGELTHDYCVMHNGVISNAHALKEEHMNELGYTYSTLEKDIKYTYGANIGKEKFNDSEALAIELARYFDARSEQVETIGTVAFFVVRLEKKTGKPLELLWGRNSSNPLECLESDNGMLLASVINDTEAEIIAPNTYEVLDLQKYFKSRAKSFDVYNAVKQSNLKFVEPPKVQAVIPAKTQSSMGFGNKTTAGEDKKNTGYTYNFNQDEEDDLEDYNAGFTQGTVNKREAAFEKMGERVCADMEVSIMDFFYNLAYEDMSDEDAMQLASDLSDVLVEKTELARSKVRPFFDTKDDNELDQMVIEELGEDIEARNKVDIAF